MPDLRSNEEFFLDLEAQLERANRSLELITAEFEKTASGAELSRAGRIETKEFISSVKHVLDQITVRVWRTLVYSELPQEFGEKRLSVIYYPYAADEQMLRSALGKMIDLKRLEAGIPIPGEEMFASWLRAMQPIQSPAYEPLYTIGRLSRLPHQKLIDQRKRHLFLVEALSPGGGGASIRFKDKPGRFTIWTYRDKHRVATGMGGGYPITDDPDAELTVFEFDPDTMDFNSVPGARTSVQEVMECQVEEMEFDALALFHGALWSAIQIRNASAFLF
jgi:hypothetical protein